ncbi:MAG: hypothetical protein CMJ78_20945 [Planctomycetaceae bacterium]|nr:hypothetical protein [Planctomycetaceae bacterium]
MSKDTTNKPYIAICVPLLLVFALVCLEDHSLPKTRSIVRAFDRDVDLVEFKVGKHSYTNPRILSYVKSLFKQSLDIHDRLVTVAPKSNSSRTGRLLFRFSDKSEAVAIGTVFESDAITIHDSDQTFGMGDSRMITFDGAPTQPAKLLRALIHDKYDEE